MVPWQGLQGLTGAVAVGGLSLTSLFLLAAVFAPNLLLAIDVVSRSTAWAIVVAAPLISLAYVVGLLTSAAAESLFVRFGRLRLADLADELRTVSKLSDLVVTRYQQMLNAELMRTVLERAYVPAAFARPLDSGSSFPGGQPQHPIKTDMPSRQHLMSAMRDRVGTCRSWIVARWVTCGVLCPEAWRLRQFRRRLANGQVDTPRIRLIGKTRPCYRHRTLPRADVATAPGRSKPHDNRSSV